LRYIDPDGMAAQYWVEYQDEMAKNTRIGLLKLKIKKVPMLGLLNQVRMLIVTRRIQTLSM
jgi:hypothetical protein